MSKFYIISPEGVPPNPVLFPTMIPTFEANGHTVVNNIEDCDVVLIDLHTRMFDYNNSDINKICQRENPVVTFCEWDRGNLSLDEWPYPLTVQQQSVFNHIKENGINAAHFCRLLDSTKLYPTNLYPYEKPISYDEPFLTSDELFNREYDICYIANQSPSRDAIAKALLNDSRLKCDILIGGKKLEWTDFLQRHKRAKLFISSGAGGFTDERVQCLFSVAGIIRERSDQLLAHDFSHQENCLRIDSPPTKEDIDTIVEIVKDKEMLYEIYKNGYEFIKKYYSKEYIANYISDTILKHL